ncbi:hypothetical protein [Streptomyces sp. T028]|uniref:hypothetical protein n=1 Tax=Streptomyces sp. T028 TaxID=3394379 RepID=UPI003A846357
MNFRLGNFAIVHREAKLRLHAVCEVEGHRPWIVVAEVANPGVEYISDGSDEMEIPEQYR